MSICCPNSLEVDLVCDLAWMAGCDGIEEQPIAADAADHPGSTRVIVAIHDASDLTSQLGERSWELIERDPDVWIDSWKPWAQAVDLGPIVIRPPWIESPMAPPPVTVVSIDPGRAWGHGAHPSTRLLASWLVESPPVGRSVADLGCGSGVLAILSAVLGARSVSAVDIDPAARDATNANVAVNQDLFAVGTVLATLGSISATDGWPSVDLVIANIDAPALDGAAETLVRLVAPSGELWLSGMITERAESLITRFRSAIEAAGRCPLICTITELEGWTAVRFVIS